MSCLGLDVGTGYCKAYTATGRVIFPSLVLMREKKLGNVWSRIKRRPMVLIGEGAEEAINEGGRIIRPLLEGRIFHDEAYTLIVKEALEKLRLKPEETKAVTGTLSRVSEADLEKLENLLKSSASLAEVQIYPASLGTLISMGLESGVILDIGEGATNLLAVEDREVIDFTTTIVAVDAVLNAIKTRLSTDSDVELREEEVRLLVTSLREKLIKYTPGGVKELTAVKVEDMVKLESLYFAEEIADILRGFLRTASTSMLENVILTGGGTYLFEEPLKTLSPEITFKKPINPSFANAEGLYKVAEAVFQEAPSPEISARDSTEDRSEPETSVTTASVPEKVTITPSD